MDKCQKDAYEWCMEHAEDVKNFPMGEWNAVFLYSRTSALTAEEQFELERGSDDEDG
jgi:hypothetical protein